MSTDAIDAVVSTFDSHLVRAATEQTLREITTNAVIVDVTTQESMGLFIVTPADELHNVDVLFTARPMIANPTLVVVTSTKFGHATIGSIDIVTDERADVRFTTTLPRSLISVDEVRYDHASGRVLVNMRVLPQSVAADDLNAPNTALGRLVRYSVAQRVVSAQATRTNFDDVSARVESLKRRISSRQP